MSILKADSVSVFFHEAVDGAMRSRGVTATEGATTYVVSLLSDYAKPTTRAEEALERPLTLLLDDALHEPNLGERFERLRTLGDGVLYTAGFFADHFEARGVDPNYVMGIGRTAYHTAGSLLRASSTRDLSQAAKDDLFGELSENFAAFVAVIAEVADATVAMGVHGSKGLLKIYERWLKTQSSTLADALSSHGFVPSRGVRIAS
ncbi:MAG: hypothetical protein JNL38_15420 [Myxococcales bacterium]|jgi:hypothetical protein|nr:hypothetical protein [Myxococcales bacterium]